jgi:hypothetical protein
MLKATPKSTTNATAGIKWNDSYATNNSAQNIRGMVSGNELNPFDAQINKPDPWEYDPSKPLFDNRDKGGNGRWYTKNGDQFRQHYRHTSGSRYGPYRNYGSSPIDTRKINPHTGKFHEKVAPTVSYNKSMFDDYFGKYLNSMG